MFDEGARPTNVAFQGNEPMDAEHKRPLYAFVLVSVLCAFLVGAAVVRGDALSLTFHPSVPLSAPPAVAEASADVRAEVPVTPVAASLPERLSIQPALESVVTDDTAITTRSRTPAQPEGRAQRPVKGAAVNAQRKAMRTLRKAEHRAAKALRKAKREAAKAQRKRR